MSGLPPPELSGAQVSSETKKKLIFKRWWVWFIVGSIVFYAVMPKKHASDSSTPVTTSSTSSTTSTIESTTIPELSYLDILNPGIVASDLSKLSCKSLTKAIATQQKANLKYMKLSEAVADNPYRGQEFLNANSWTYSRQEETLTFELEQIVGVELASGTSIKPTRNMQIAFLSDSIITCELTSSFNEVIKSSSDLDTLISNIRVRAKNLPWYPEGFSQYNSEIAYRAADKGSYSCSFSRCIVYFFITKKACPSFYVEVTAYDDTGTNVGWTNDTAQGVKAGVQVKLKFDLFEDSASTVEISDVSCY